MKSSSMEEISIKIGRTRSCFFTKTQKNKLQAGIDIFLNVLKHKSFIDDLLKFSWINSDNKRYYRFYHASGLSNAQVLARLQNCGAYFEELGYSDKLVLLPFNSRKEIQTYNTFNSPLIWISANCLNNNWYTPIHVASALGHELALLLGLDSSKNNYSKKEFEKNKVPHFIGNQILKTAKLWRKSISDISLSLELIDTKRYNYFPSSCVSSLLGSESMPHHQTSLENLTASILVEQESLIALQENLGPSETARLVCLEEVLIQLDNLKGKLIDSSLDGSELDFRSKPKNQLPQSPSSSGL